MFQVTPQLQQFAVEAYTQLKFWLPLVSFIWAVQKGFTWVKEIRTKDFPDLAADMKEMKASVNSVHTEIKDQTNQVVNEIKELRGDFRTYFAPPEKVKAARANRKNS